MPRGGGTALVLPDCGETSAIRRHATKPGRDALAKQLRHYYAMWKWSNKA